ncbi:MAG: phosphohydrolase [Bacteroidetes bacterium GWF2_49_14]|nr:MAG: phosphohydrolase [Bacteroidetes bacterium GWF2_49_14]HBB93435.1 phosphohydrolase [Bacteroidales bacterium]
MTDDFRTSSNKRKIINDPLYGFITIPSDLICDLVDHPFFQRLRRIRQLGMTFYVYPGANHTRFQHALGAAHLMSSALEVIERKGCAISEEEREAAVAAILLHDIGHGPFSHALEHSIVQTVDHEVLSQLFMDHLNRETGGALDLAIGIFTGSNPRPFLHQMVSSQLDMDRLDYLNRDSFFTGVTEGVVGSDRILKMLRVFGDQLVVERKGIYSIEKYLISRRLMYWQVYLHKTVIAAEQMLVKALSRARLLAADGTRLFTTPALHDFLYPGPLSENPLGDLPRLLSSFSQLDDSDIFSVLKVWAGHQDPVLSLLSGGLLNRRLFSVRIRKTAWESTVIEELRQKAMKIRKISWEESKFLVFTDIIANNAYADEEDQILFLDNSGQLLRLSETSDIVNVPLLSRTDSKHILCYPKWLFQDSDTKRQF